MVKETIVTLAFMLAFYAQTGAQTGKKLPHSACFSLFHLERSATFALQLNMYGPRQVFPINQHKYLMVKSPTVARPRFLPQWSPEDLPFFCKIEHKAGKHLPVLFKFRLGSVDYVDWLEGKGVVRY